MITDSLERCLAKYDTITDDDPIVKEDVEMLEKDSEHEEISLEEVQ